MRNRYLERFDRIVKIRVTGKNIHHYVRRIIQQKIKIIHLHQISYREIEIILKYSEYLKLLEYKSIYQVTLLQFMGKMKIDEFFKKNVVLFSFLIVGICFLVFLSRVVFQVEVIHQDSEIRELLVQELEKYNVKKYTMKKSYAKLEEIEDKILEENKDRLEWIEILEYGTKYMVRVEERKIDTKVENFRYQSIVSKKNAIVVEIDAKQGEKVKNVNDYVKKGDTVISGYITLPNNTRVQTMALGRVYGEVWYRVTIDYPFVYQESNLTGKSKTVYAIYFLGKRIGLFDFEQYRSFESKNQVLVRSNLLNIQFVREKQYEVESKDEVYTEDMVRNKAIDYIKNKLKKDHEEVVEVRDVKILSSSSNEKGVRFRLFVRVIEDIGEVVELPVEFQKDIPLE